MSRSGLSGTTKQRLGIGIRSFVVDVWLCGTRQDIEFDLIE